MLWQLGELVEARAELERALAMFEAVGGPDHENVIILRERLRRVGRELEAEAWTRS